MLELPEILTITAQMRNTLTGKRIVEGVCGANPHKFAFLNHPAAEYGPIMADHTLGEITSRGNLILAPLEPDWALLVGDMGGRILYHEPGAKLPERHQLLLRFSDGTALTTTIQMWGCIQLWKQSDLPQHPALARPRISPLSPEFTYAYFEELLAEPTEREKKSVKFFAISKPGLGGVGNGCLHDILFRARLDPRHRVIDLTPPQARAFYDATIDTLTQMVAQGGRAIERDLFNRPGGYEGILGSHSAGKPCPVCGQTIEKIAYLGGAAYFCPHCQV